MIHATSLPCSFPTVINAVATAKLNCDSDQKQSIEFLLHLLAADASDKCVLIKELSALLSHFQKRHGTEGMNLRVAILCDQFSAESQQDPLAMFQCDITGDSWVERQPYLH